MRNALEHALQTAKGNMSTRKAKDTHKTRNVHLERGRNIHVHFF